MSTPVEKIKDRLGIAEIIGSYITLQKAGGSLKAKCPFHNEKTPSFFVSPDRGSYYCFGCGAKGDIFTFVEQFEGLDFMGALKILAERAGVPLVFESKESKTEREQLFQALAAAAKFFEAGLKDSPETKSYLAKRSLTPKTIAEFQLGFAADDWSALNRHLKSKGFSDKILELAGLIKRGEKNFYDRFRGRVMFPISDSAGRIVGFSGRTLKKDADEAKYLNSPETPLFFKSRILYGFDKAKLAIRQKDYVVLLEGQMDLLMAHQCGFKNSVATSGTAMTEDHVALLKRLTDRLMICYDPDEAGFKAALRAGALSIQKGMEVKIATLPEGQDPADLLKTDAKKFADALKQSTHLIDFLLAGIKSKGYDKRILAKTVGKEVLPYVAILPSRLEQSHYIGTIAEFLGAKYEDVAAELARVTPIPIRFENGANSTGQPAFSNNQFSREDNIEKKLFGIFFWQEKKSSSDFNFNAFKAALQNTLGPDFTDSENRWRTVADELAIETEALYGNLETLKRDADELIKGLERNQLEIKAVLKRKELSLAEKAGDQKKTKELLGEFQEISSKLEKIKQT